MILTAVRADDTGPEIYRAVHAVVAHLNCHISHLLHALFWALVAFSHSSLYQMRICSYPHSHGPNAYLIKALLPNTHVVAV